MSGDQDAGLGAHLPAHDQLLLVAAGERYGQGVRAGRPDVVLPHDPLGVGAGRAPVDERAPYRRGAGLVTQDAVLPQRRVEQHALTVPVLRDEADPALATGAGAPVGDVLAAQGDAAVG